MADAHLYICIVSYSNQGYFLVKYITCSVHANYTSFTFIIITFNKKLQIMYQNTKNREAFDQGFDVF